MFYRFRSLGIVGMATALAASAIVVANPLLALQENTDWPFADKTKAGRPTPSLNPEQQREYVAAIHKTAEMANDQEAMKLAERHGLQVLNLTWEDTGRYKGSAVGPNISDMTIQVALKNAGRGGMETFLMPVIRFPNFSDITGELSPYDFTLLVGNQKGRDLRRVSLAEFLENPRQYLTKADSWTGTDLSLMAPRDEKVLVSAQACFLPVPKKGSATFNPVLFNYQSYPGDPAVLTILATREGTSVTVIDNKRDGVDTGWSWGQRLFHNENGKRASLTGQRLSDYIEAGRPGSGGKGVKVADTALNMVLLIQIPLQQKERHRGFGGGGGFGGAVLSDGVVMKAKAGAGRAGSDVESAVIGHGDFEGPFTEFDNMPVKRDTRYPIRVTVQFYKATSNGVVSQADLTQIKHDIDSVYKRSDIVGSLVTEGNTGRITEYDGPKVQPHDWWEKFWRRYESYSGVSREEAIARLRRLLGKDYETCKVTDLYLRDTLRKR